MLEVMICITLMGVLFSFSLKAPSGTLKSSKREAPIILMGCLNEELRDSLEIMRVNQLMVEKGQFVHRDVNRRMKKSVFYDEDVTVEYAGALFPTFGINTDFTFRINNKSNQSGRVNFLRNGKVECYLMIHLGSGTMDLRE